MDIPDHAFIPFHSMHPFRLRTIPLTPLIFHPFSGKLRKDPRHPSILVRQWCCPKWQKDEGLFPMAHAGRKRGIKAHKVPTRPDRLHFDQSNNEWVWMANQGRSRLGHVRSSTPSLVRVRRPGQSPKASSDRRLALHVHAPRPLRPAGPVPGLRRRARHCRLRIP